jgi:hypothetical protein
VTWAASDSGWGACWGGGRRSEVRKVQ